MTLKELYEWGEKQGMTDWELYDGWGMKLGWCDIKEDQNRHVIEIS